MQFQFPEFKLEIDTLENQLKQHDEKLWKISYLDPWWDYQQVIINIVLYNKIDVYKCYDKFYELYLKHDGLNKFIKLNLNFWVKNQNDYYQFRFLSLKRFLNKETLEGPLDSNLYEIIPNNEMPKLY
ncbi:hypothetical protein [Bartonella sp. HY406]|uniref:hypothetical protein n=1 Tax=Bartonella sp. HY406 TaxID=2979331 RepID=UPI0021C76671|nr:hypothetical protein [Bartonella sp. HY406]UXN03142.1 hypothetical protein N6B01_11850 [Bartonella sp. HY406]